jgi:hypothetical protein
MPKKPTFMLRICPKLSSGLVGVSCAIAVAVGAAVVVTSLSLPVNAGAAVDVRRAPALPMLVPRTLPIAARVPHYGRPAIA